MQSTKVLEGAEVGIGQLFFGHNYWSSKCNVRGYAWSVEEANELMLSVESVDLEDGKRSLGSIIVTKHTLTSEQTDRIGIPKASDMFDVHDGQQRLVTLCLLLAACRDVLQAVAGIDGSKGIMNDHEAPEQMERFSLAIAIKRTKVNAVVPRIAMFAQEPLRSILTKKEPVVSAENEDDVPNEPAPKKKSRKGLSVEDKEAQRIHSVYDAFVDSFQGMALEPRVKRACEIGTKILDQMLITKMVYNSLDAAQQQVEDQYHGKSITPLEFFLYTISISALDTAAVQKTTRSSCWLLVKGTSEDLTHDACVAVAKGLTALDDDITEKRVMRTKEVSYFNKIAKKMTAEVGGAAFFEKYVSPATNRLMAFRNKTLAVPVQELAKTMRFLQYSTQQGFRCKDLESVIVFALVVLKHNDDLCFFLRDCLEPIFLWMMTTKPLPNARAECCVKILKTLATNNDGRLSRSHSSIKVKLKLTPQEKKDTHDKLLSRAGFGRDLVSRGPAQLKIDKAICERLECRGNPSLAASRAMTEFGLSDSLDSASDDDDDEEESDVAPGASDVGEGANKMDDSSAPVAPGASDTDNGQSSAPGASYIGNGQPAAAPGASEIGFGQGSATAPPVTRCNRIPAAAAAATAAAAAAAGDDHSDVSSTNWI
jgi:Protein of unknown function DUF262